MDQLKLNVELLVKVVSRAGTPDISATASTMVGIGRGTTEVAIVALNGVVYSNSVRVGSGNLDGGVTKHDLNEGALASHRFKLMGHERRLSPRTINRGLWSGVGD